MSTTQFNDEEVNEVSKMLEIESEDESEDELGNESEDERTELEIMAQVR